MIIINFLLILFCCSFRCNNIKVIDAIIYINLDNKIERESNILKQIAILNIDAEIIRMPGQFTLQSGHLGCVVSHIRALEYARRLRYENVLIFEDDFSFNQNMTDQIKPLINEFIQEFPDYDLCMLTCGWTGNLEKVTDKISKIKEYATGPSAYIVNRKMYDKLISNLREAAELLYTDVFEQLQNDPQKKRIYETSFAFDQYWGKLLVQSQSYIFYPYLGGQNYNLTSSTMSSFE